MLEAGRERAVNSSASPCVRIRWGLAGAAPEAKLLPHRTATVIDKLQACGVSVLAPTFTSAQLARTKASEIVAPIVEIVSGISVGVLTALILSALTPEPNLKDECEIRLTVVLPPDGQGVQREVLLEGTPKSILERLDRL
jgi:hypothetical protein